MTGDVDPLRILPGRGLEALDQTLLPREERYLLLDSVEQLCEAIRTLRVRGAPLLGLVGWGAIAVAAECSDAGDKALDKAATTIKATRPTAADLGTAVDAALATA
ncbi:MAG: hypothetical protein IT304_03695, partial [Dehalococcoidia bacterium]|nr:hypothetical protein [Dehalococcoidia bacterium]